MENERLREKEVESMRIGDSFKKPAEKGRRQGEGTRQGE